MHLAQRYFENWKMAGLAWAENDSSLEFELYRSLVSNMPFGVAYCRMLFEAGRPIDFTYLMVNDAFVEQTGLKNVINKRVSEVIPGIREAAPELFERYGRVSTSGKPERYETFSHALKKWYEISAYSPKPEHFIAILDDITERKNAEAALKESEARFRQLADSMPQLVWAATPDGNLDYLNERSWEYQGLELSNPGARKWMEMIHPDDINAYVEVLVRSHQAGMPFQHECRMKCSVAGYRWHISRGAPVRDEHGKIIKWLGTSTDIHDLKTAQEAAQRSQNRLDLAQQATRSGIFDWDIQHDVIESSPVVEMLHGFTPGQYDGSYGTWLKRIHPEDRRLARQHIRNALSSGSIDGVWRTLWPDGTVRWLATRGQVLKDDSGRPVRMVGINMDITERKEAEDRLKESEEKFRALVESASDAYFVYDYAGKLIEVNQRACELLGCEREELLKLTITDVSPDLSFDEFQQMWKKLDAGQVIIENSSQRRKDGSLFPSEVRISTVLLRGEKFCIALVHDITERKQSDEIIWNQANFDALTGLPNRRFFRDRLQREVNNAKRSNLPMALLFLDLDGFKYVNDSLGHDMGDMLLKEAADRLFSCVRETDTVARLGGDEFTIILPELQDPSNIDRVARQILQVLAEPINLGEERAYVSASIGITLFPQDATDVEELIRNADQAMYSAKEGGKNRYHYFTPAMQEDALKRMRIINDMRGALQACQFEIVYQPIIELTSGSIQKAEALIRWQHPVKGLIDPIEFISAAEDTGMIASFGNWIFREAAKQASIWREMHHPAFQISVNISPVQFKNEGIAPSVWFDHLKSLGLPGQGVVVEITEGLLLEASPKVTNQLLMLRDAGIEVALDDFGTGYSSLSYLKKFDIDYIKIDKTFVMNLEESPDDMALCEAIIVMAHRLGIKVIAEGVESRKQHELLANGGCDFAQGYLFSKPVSPEEFGILLETNPFAAQECLDV